MNQDTAASKIGNDETVAVRLDTPTRLDAFAERAWSNVLGQPDRRKRFWTLAVVSVLLLVQVSPYWVPTPDAAAYLSIGKSIAAGNGLMRHGSPHLYYAPGYPLALAAWSFAFGHSFLSISIAHWCLLVLFLVSTYAWAGRMMPEYALSVAILSVVNVGVLYYFRRALSEAVFMPLLMWSAIALDDLACRRGRNRVWLLPLACVAVGYLCVVRQAGLALPLGFGILMLFHVLRRQISWPRAFLNVGAIGVCAVVATACVVVHDRMTVSAVGTEETYLAQVVDPNSTMASQLLGGLNFRVQEVGRLLIPGMFKVYGNWPDACMIVYIPVFLAVGWGWFLVARSRPDSLGLAFPFYLALYLLWPFDQGCRFMTPFVPLFWLSIVVLLGRFMAQRRLARIVVLLVPLSAVPALVYLAKDVSEAMKLDRNWATLDVLCRKVPPGETLAYLGPSRNLHLMLQTKLDAWAPILDASRGVPSGIHFILAETDALAKPDAAVPPDFTPVDRQGPFVLLREVSETH